MSRLLEAIGGKRMDEFDRWFFTCVARRWHPIDRQWRRRRLRFLLFIWERRMCAVAIRRIARVLAHAEVSFAWFLDTEGLGSKPRARM